MTPLGLALVLALALVAAPGGTAWAAVAEPPRFPEQDDGVLVEVRVDQIVLAEVIAARQGPRGLRLPLGELARALGIAVDVGPGGTARGFVLREDRAFELDVARGRAVLAGVVLPFEAGAIDVQPDDLYADLALLERWFPVALRYDPTLLLVRVVPREPLPIQLRLERERLMDANGDRVSDPRFPVVRTPYALLGDPAIDPNFGFTFAADPVSGQIKPALTFAAFANSDLAGLNVAGFAAGKAGLDGAKPLDDWRLTVGRKDPDAGLLGPLRARDVGMGYLNDPGLPLVAGSWSGNGVGISSYPVSQAVRFDRQSFRGPLPPGWDAQLLQNDYPIAYQVPGSGAEYRFDDIPLVMGPNEFTVQLNGPQGQRRQETRRVNIGSTMTPPAEHRYRLLEGFDAEGRPRLLAAYDVGLNSQLSLALGAARVPVPDAGARHYGLAGLRGTLGGVFWHGDAAADERGGLAASAGAQVTTGTFGASLAQSVARDFASDEFRPGADPVTARTTARLDARLPPEAWAQGSAVLAAAADRRLGGAWEPRLTNQLSTRLAGLTATHVANFTADMAGPFADASFDLGGVWRAVNVRGQVAYNPREATAVSLTGSGQGWLAARYTLGTTFQVATRQPTLSFDVNRVFGAVTAGVNMAASAAGNVAFGLTLTSGLLQGNGGWLASGQSMATSGSAVVHAFLDTNRNGRPDPGERPLPGLAVEVGGQAATTDARGVGVVRGLAPYVPIDADFSKVTLEDPLLVSARKGAHLTPRPGRTTVVDLPVIAVGEVYGTVRITSAGTVEEFGGATVQLVNGRGQVVASAVSGLDGYFALTEVAPGSYRLRVDPVQLGKLGFEAGVDRAVRVGAEGGVVDGQDFLVRAPKARK